MDRIVGIILALLAKQVSEGCGEIKKMINRRTFIKRYIYGVLLSAVLSSFYAFSVTTFDEVVSLAYSSIKTGNAKQLSDTFSNSVSLSVKGDEGVYTKFQVELLLDDFFRNNKVDEIKEVQRSNNSSSSFAVFSITSGKTTYRIFMKFFVKDKAFKISEFRIE